MWKKNRKWPDVRNESAILAKMLMEAHEQRCLHDNMAMYSKSAAQQKESFVLVNDDESFNTSSSASSAIRRQSTAAKSLLGVAASLIKCYYPYLHRTLETLGRAAASSSYFASSNGKNRIVSIRCGIVIRIFVQSYKRYKKNPIEVQHVMDAKLQ